MNYQKPESRNHIEWTRVILPGGERLPGYTWNPIGGCMHGCTWKMPDGSVTQCYAKTIAEKFDNAYPHGFEHHYWREHELYKPMHLMQPAGIFANSMSDLYGHWVPDVQQRRVLNVMRQADWHIFQTLSKYPNAIPAHNPFPSHIWTGVSLPAGHQMSETGAARALMVYLRHMAQIDAPIRFMSIEPLWFDAAVIFEQWLQDHDRLPFEWAIIGAASKGNRIFQPRSSWVKGLLDILDRQGIPVFFKGNLRGNPAAAAWREDFPGHVSIPSTQSEQLSLW